MECPKIQALLSMPFEVKLSIKTDEYHCRRRWINGYLYWNVYQNLIGSTLLSKKNVVVVLCLRPRLRNQDRNYQDNGRKIGVCESS